MRSSCNLPGSQMRRAASPPLLGFAPDGVYPAPTVTGRAVRSYRTISPLPVPGTGGIFSAALSIRSPCLDVIQHPALWSPDFPRPATANAGRGRLPHLEKSELITLVFVVIQDPSAAVAGVNLAAFTDIGHFLKGHMSETSTAAAAANRHHRTVNPRIHDPLV